jgi:aminoglycoside phosphotransferase (APT) family kinase protein
MAEADIRAALTRELAGWLGHATAIGPLERLSGGESSDCYRFDLAPPQPGVPSALVLRLMRDDQAAAHECAVQAAVAAQEFPAPRLLRTGMSASAFDRPFSIMPFVSARDPVSLEGMRRLPRLLAETMRDIHALRIAATDRDVDAVVGELRRSQRPEIAKAASWFDDNGFDSARFVLCHGDLHARNIIVSGGRVVAVLDWEIALFAPPEYDVARTEVILRLMPGIGPSVLRPAVRLLGRRVSRQFVEAYAALNRLDATTLERCRALHALRLVALVRAGGGALGVRELWRPFERELARRWQAITGVAV